MVSHSVNRLRSGSRISPQSPRGYGSAQQLAGQVSDLKIELARRDAEVEYLEGQLAEAVAANRPHVSDPIDHSSSQVLTCYTTYFWLCHHALVLSAYPGASFQSSIMAKRLFICTAVQAVSVDMLKAA